MKLPMLILRGAPALSDFKVQKILKTCADANLPVTGIYAEFMHFADLTAQLSDSELDKLNKLLKYGPTIADTAYWYHFSVGIKSN